MELISREAAIKAVNVTLADYIPILLGRAQEIPLECALAIKRLPAVEPKQGNWIEIREDEPPHDLEMWICSACGHYELIKPTPYCPICGARLKK